MGEGTRASVWRARELTVPATHARAAQHVRGIAHTHARPVASAHVRTRTLSHTARASCSGFMWPRVASAAQRSSNVTSLPARRRVARHEIITADTGRGVIVRCAPSSSASPGASATPRSCRV